MSRRERQRGGAAASGFRGATLDASGVAPVAGSVGVSTAETGGVSLSEKARKSILIAWQERKREEVLHPFLQEKAPIGLLFHLQAALLARFLRGDLDGYPSYFWK